MDSIYHVSADGDQVLITSCGTWSLEVLYSYGIVNSPSSMANFAHKMDVNLFNLGPLYTRSQGHCPTQIKHSYWCKSCNRPQGLYNRSQGKHDKKKIFSICLKLRINVELYSLVLAPKAGKWIPFATLGANVTSISGNAQGQG
jgi:hypothetical protein